MNADSGEQHMRRLITVAILLVEMGGSAMLVPSAPAAEQLEKRKEAFAR